MRVRPSRLAALGAALLVASTVTAAQAVPSACADASTVSFSDVPDTGLFADAVECAAGFGLVGGFGDGTFGPTQTVNRGQAAAFVASLIETANGGTTLTPASPNPFSDVADNGTFAPAILKLVNIDVVSGTTATTYEPSRSLTRGEMAQIVANALEHLGVTLDTSAAGFTDTAGLFADAINALANLDVVQGITSTTFSPGADVTRGELASFTAESIGALDTASLWNPPVSDPDDPTSGTGSGSGTVITVNNGGSQYEFVTSAGVRRTVTYDNTNDSFSMDGSAVNQAIFQARINPGDTVVFVEDATTTDADTHTVTNRTVLSGRVGQVDITANTFQIIEPFTGIAIGDGDPSDEHDNDPFVYAVDGSDTFTGSANNFTTFEANIQVWDTITVTDPEATSYDDFALSNQTLTGRVSALDKSQNTDEDVGPTTTDDAEFAIGGIGDVYDDALVRDPVEDSLIMVSADGTTQAYTLNGTSGATLNNVYAALSNGDTISYSRATGTETFTITDSSPVSLASVIVDENTVIATNTLGYVNGTTQTTFDWSVVAAGQIARFFVDNVEVLDTDFEAALSVGDVVQIQDDDDGSDTDQILRLTNTSLTGVVVNVGGANDTTQDETFDVRTSGGVTLVTGFDVAAAFTDGIETPANGAIDRFRVNGGEVSYTVFEDYLFLVAADGTPDDTITYTADNGAGASILSLTTDETLP